MRLRLGISREVDGARMSEVVELAGKPAGQPVVVGRGTEATVVIPDPDVSTRHCLLWLEGETWFVQDAGSRHGTVVDGEPATMTMALRVGDVIRLGTAEGSPVLRVEGVGEEYAPPAPSHATSSAVAGAGGGRVARAADPVAAMAEENEETPLREGLDEDEQVPLEGLTYPAAAPARTARAAMRKPPGKSTETLVLYGVVGVILIAGGTWFAIDRVMKQRGGRIVQVVQLGPDGKPAQGAPATLPAQRAPKQGSGVTGAAVGEAARPVFRPANADAPKVYLAAERKRPSDTSEDPVLKGDAWNAVAEARGGIGHPAQAIWAYTDFMRQHPGKFVEELNKDIDVALDRLWWMRIDEVLQKQQRLADSIQVKNNEVSREDPGTELQKSLLAERDKLQVQRRLLLEELEAGMGFTRAEAPNINDVEEVARFRAQRDPVKYAEWRKGVLRAIVESRRLPWGNW